MKSQVVPDLKSERQNHDDRRRFPRFEANCVVHVTSLTKGGEPMDFTSGESINVSTGGMRIRLFSHPLPAGARVQVSFTIAETEVEAEGTVVYVDQVGGYAMGVEFRDLSAASAAAIAAVVNSLAQDSWS
jgi:hypothetical protein